MGPLGGMVFLHSEGCEGVACIASVITEVMVLMSNGIERLELYLQKLGIERESFI